MVQSLQIILLHFINKFSRILEPWLLRKYARKIKLKINERILLNIEKKENFGVPDF